MPQVILITGGNGFIGFGTTLNALQQGYHVRATVRRQSAIDTILKSKTAARFHAEEALSFAIIPDISKKDAFFEASRGCRAIIHIAAPLGNEVGDLSRGVLLSIDAVLYAAENSPTIKRIIWTGSMMGGVPFERQFEDHPDNVAIANGQGSLVPTITSASIAPLPDAPAPVDSPGIQRYTYAKIAATHKLHEAAKAMPAPATFDIVIICPAWVMGPSEIMLHKDHVMNGISTNSLLGFLYGPYLSYGYGITGRPVHKPMIAATVHIDDVAEAHVNALLVSVEDRIRTFILSSDGPDGPVHDDAIGIVKKFYPEEAKHLASNAHHGTIKAKIDASDSESELLGHSLKSYETTVRDFVEWFKDLPGDKRGIDYEAVMAA